MVFKMLATGWLILLCVLGGFSAFGKTMELIYLSKLMRRHEKIKYTNPKLYKKLN